MKDFVSFNRLTQLEYIEIRGFHLNQQDLIGQIERSNRSCSTPSFQREWITSSWCLALPINSIELSCFNGSLNGDIWMHSWELIKPVYNSTFLSFIFDKLGFPLLVLSLIHLIQWSFKYLCYSEVDLLLHFRLILKVPLFYLFQWFYDSFRRHWIRVKDLIKVLLGNLI